MGRTPPSSPTLRKSSERKSPSLIIRRSLVRSGDGHNHSRSVQPVVSSFYIVKDGVAHLPNVNAYSHWKTTKSDPKFTKTVPKLSDRKWVITTENHPTLCMIDAEGIKIHSESDVTYRVVHMIGPNKMINYALQPNGTKVPLMYQNRRIKASSIKTFVDDFTSLRLDDWIKNHLLEPAFVTNIKGWDVFSNDSPLDQHPKERGKCIDFFGMFKEGDNDV